MEMKGRMMMDTKETIAVRKLTDDELNAVAAGANCAAGVHIATLPSDLRTSGPTNAWQDWMQSYFGV